MATSSPAPAPEPVAAPAAEPAPSPAAAPAQLVVCIVRPGPFGAYGQVRDDISREWAAEAVAAGIAEEVVTV